MSGGELVTCCVCGKALRKAAAVGINGRWSHADPKCFGEALRKLPSVRDAAAQLGLFGGTKRGSP
jgi:hypothetical protein